MECKQCPACGSDNYVLYPHPVYRRCAECYSLYQYTDIDIIKDYYEDRQPNFTNQTGSYRTYLRIMEKFIELERYRLVDVGAGDGLFLDLAKAFVGQAMGFDASPTAMVLLKNKGYWIDKLEDVLSPKIITAFQVIEHVQDPRLFINNLCIRKDDWLVLTSPAADSPTATRCHSTGRWRSLSPSHHLCLFSRRGLEKLAIDCDLALVHFEYTWSGCHGLIDNFRKNVLVHLKWPLKRLIGRKDPYPIFYGRNSFLAILRK
jgi:hypothetical protein